MLRAALGLAGLLAAFMMFNIVIHSLFAGSIAGGVIDNIISFDN
jgi:hypothetical protein